MPKYGGLHSFLFIPWEDDPKTLIEAIKKQFGGVNPEGPLHFAAVFEEGGDFGGFAHFSKDTASELGELIGVQLRAAGVRSDTEIEGKVFKDGTAQQKGVKRSSPRFAAICRIKVQGRSNLEVIDEVAEQYDGEAPFGGGSQLLRRNQALIELVSDDRDELERFVQDLRSRDYGPTRVGIADTGAKKS